MKARGFGLFTLALVLIGFLVYIVVAGMPWINGTYIRSAKDAIRYGLDLRGGAMIEYGPQIAQGQGAPTPAQMETARQIIRKRLDLKNYLDATVTVSQSTNRLIVELPGVKDLEKAEAELGQTALLEFIELQSAPSDNSPAAFGSVILSGTDVVDAKPVFYNNQWIIDFTITKDAQRRFADATARLAPKEGRIAITLDRQIISAPVVKNKIDSDKAQIEGDFTQDSARELANLIKSGALPFRLTVVNSSFISPTLGTNALDISIKAGIIGLILVALFMILWYRVPGVVASLALLAYTAFVVFILARWKITLTLPGIAGVILSIGMAVDANVIIFERLKEEIRSGKTIRAAIDAGFNRAWPAIRDANVTTIISTVVLFVLGSGPIRGFALTLIIGVIVSMLSAILFVRFMMKQLYDMGLTNTSLYGYKGGKA